MEGSSIMNIAIPSIRPTRLPQENVLRSFRKISLTMPDTMLMRMIFFCSRLMRDEYAQYLYTKFDKGNRMYYRKTIDRLMDKTAVKLKQSFRNVGFPEVFDYLENMAADNADEVERHLVVIRNRITTELVQCIPYEYVDPMMRLSLTFTFARLAKNICEDNGIKLKSLFNEIMEMISDYIDSMNIDMWKRLDNMLDARMLIPLMKEMVELTSKNIGQK